MIPDDLDDAGEARRRRGEVGHLVERDDQRLLAGQSGDEAQGCLPAGEAAAGQVERVLTEVATDSLREPTQLDRLRLLGGPEENGPLAADEVGHQERLAHPAASPQDDELRGTGQRLLPTCLQLLELGIASQQRLARHDSRC